MRYLRYLCRSCGSLEVRIRTSAGMLADVRADGRLKCSCKPGGEELLLSAPGELPDGCLLVWDEQLVMNMYG